MSVDGWKDDEEIIYVVRCSIESTTLFGEFMIRKHHALMIKANNDVAVRMLRHEYVDKNDDILNIFYMRLITLDILLFYT